MDIVHTLNKLALAGGEWVLYLLLLSSVLSLAVVIQKAIFFYRNRIDWAGFSEMLMTFIKVILTLQRNMSEGTTRLQRGCCLRVSKTSKKDLRQWKKS